MLFWKCLESDMIVEKAAGDGGTSSDEQTCSALQARPAHDCDAFAFVEAAMSKSLLHQHRQCCNLAETT